MFFVAGWKLATNARVQASGALDKPAAQFRRVSLRSVPLFVLRVD